MDNQCGYSQFAGHVYADANEQRRTSHGVNSSAYANDMLLAAAAVLNSALKAAEPKYQHRVTMDMMHLQVGVFRIVSTRLTLSFSLLFARSTSD